MEGGALLLVASLIVPAETGTAPSSFSGTWILNREKSSELPGKPPTKLVVKIDSKQMSLRSTKDGTPAKAMDYKLDGSETRAEEDEGMFVVKKRGRLKQLDSGSKIELVTVFTFVGKGMLTIDAQENTLTQTLELVEGGLRVVGEERDGDTVVERSNLFYEKK